MGKERTLRRTLRELALGMLFAGMLAYSMTLHIETASATAGQIFKMYTNGGGSTFYEGRCFRVDFYVQTDSMDVNSADLVVPYSSTVLQPHSNSSCTSVATSLLTDGLFPQYPGAGNVIEDDTLKLTGVDTGGDDPVNTGAAPNDELFAHIFFKVLSTSGSSPLNFSFTLGSTTDTNMAEDGGAGTDVLDSVENLTLTFASDTTKPQFSSLSPAASATGVSITADLSFVITDSGAGVNSSAVSAERNGSALSVTVSGCSTTDSNRVPSCNGSADLGTMSYNTVYTITATGGDLAVSTNTGSRTWQFTTEDDTDEPYVQNQSPASGATGVAVSSNVVFRIKDFKGQAGVVAGLGVDLSTVQVTITGAGITTETYQDGDPEFSSSGTSENYQITINPASNFPENTLVYVNISGSDLHSPPNTMTTVQYSFRTVDSQGPQFSNFSPAQSATNVVADTNIAFTVSDVGAGIDIGNTTVTVEGTAYDSGDPEFGYTGTSASYDITINPASNFTGGQQVDVVISTRDLASPTPNTASSSYLFTIASSCTTCSVDQEDPERFDRSATVDDTIVFHVKDTGDGINQNSISVTLTGSGDAVPVNPVTYTGASAEMDITGTSADYTVTITLPADISENTAYSVTIDASDINGLAMSTVSYTFMNDTTTGSGETVYVNVPVASVCPECESCSADGGGGGRRGSGGGNTERIVTSLASADLPTIIARRRLPGHETPVEQVLTEELARRIEKCYIEEDDVHAAAPLTHFEDVAPGAWYEEAVAAFIAEGILDDSQKRFRGEEPSVRAEVTKLLVLLAGKEPATSQDGHFDDVETGDWFFGFVETAAEMGWMKGYDNCYGTRPCFTRPDARITRAEAAALAVRFFGLEFENLAPQFEDNPAGAWFSGALRAAADHCIVQGTAGSALSFPNRTVNRAEIIVMLYRARQNLRYGKDCDWSGKRPEPSAYVPNAPEGTRLAASVISSDSPPLHASATEKQLPLAALGFILLCATLPMISLYKTCRKEPEEGIWGSGGNKRLHEDS